MQLKRQADLLEQARRNVDTRFATSKFDRWGFDGGVNLLHVHTKQCLGLSIRTSQPEPDSLKATGYG